MSSRFAPIASINPSLKPPIFTIAICTLLFTIGLQLPNYQFFNSSEEYLPVHTLLEFFAISICIMIFALGWNIRKASESDHLPIVGSVFLAAGLLDLAHTLSYVGMPALVTENIPDKSINFWLAARFFAALGLATLAILPTHQRLHKSLPYIGLMLTLIIVVAFSVVAFYYPAWLPHTFNPGSGLTSFKVKAEYFFVAVSVISAWIFINRADKENNVAFAWLAAAAWTIGLAELLFTQYRTLIDQLNLFGHLFKAAGYSMIFHALFVATIHRPYQRLSEANLQVKQVLKDQRITASAFEVQDAVIITDEKDIVLRVNKAFSKLTGYSTEEVVGKKSDFFKSAKLDPDFLQLIHASLSHDKFWAGEIYDNRKDGTVYLKRLTISAVCDDEGVVTNYVMAFTDLSQYKEAQESVHRLAFYDPLTNLPNRRLLLDRLEKQMLSENRNKSYGAVLFIDLDNFKTLNDTRGHAFGDLMLKEVAIRLQDCLRVNDTVARLGGDEFVVMLEGLSHDAILAAGQAEAVGDKVLEAIKQPYILDGGEYYSSASIGVSMFRGDEVSIDELLKHADTAMYQSKLAGRNTQRFFDPSMQVNLETRAALEVSLRQAVVDEQFKLYYQMQVDHNCRIIGAEVLLRWQHPERGLVPPMQFIPLAEETGLILPIGRYVLETACLQLKSWSNNKRNSKLVLAVNVSARQFRQEDFVDQVQDVLTKTGANPNVLKLELTESLVLENIADTIDKMQKLRSLGICFSMDDFGTGFSSLACLKSLPLSQLKIDQSFVRDITSDTNDAAIIKTIIGMANTLDLNVIAEGVETEAQLSALKKYRCRSFQGYLFSKPVPVGDFEQQLKSYKYIKHKV
jgi:diguanylate cyclase (GGDEF)-like protein/PAS domain S-box-containing protein